MSLGIIYPQRVLVTGLDLAWIVNQGGSGWYRDEGGKWGSVQVRSSSVSSFVAQSPSLESISLNK